MERGKKKEHGVQMKGKRRIHGIDQQQEWT
jgi:hypothetical protein